MAAWSPAKEVADSELVGRRLFSAPSKPNVLTNGVGDLDLNHFLDTRPEISIDRLGRSNVEKAVVAVLNPLAETAASNFTPPKRFDGWAGVRAKHLTQNRNLSLEVVASPITDPKEFNKFHAHLQQNTEIEPYFLALHLWHIFRKHGEGIKSASIPAAMPFWQRWKRLSFGMLKKLPFLKSF